MKANIDYDKKIEGKYCEYIFKYSVKVKYLMDIYRFVAPFAVTYISPSTIYNTWTMDRCVIRRILFT